MDTRNKQVRTFLGGVVGFTAGAGLMYFFDPDRGRRRRAIGRDKLFQSARRFRKTVSIAMRDLFHRAYGLGATFGRPGKRRAGIEDVIAARVRARMGHVLTHPIAIEVEVEGDDVKLKGFVREDEAEGLIRAVRAIRGVVSITDALKRCTGATPPRTAARATDVDEAHALRALELGNLDGDENTTKVALERLDLPAADDD
jgi:hypothetical protein